MVKQCTYLLGWWLVDWVKNYIYIYISSFFRACGAPFNILEVYQPPAPPDHSDSIF
jgi:hypothetical protein